MNLAWTKHIKDKGRKEDFIRAVRGSTLVLGRLEEIFKDRLRAINSTETSIEDFDSISWSHKQAFRNGQKAMIKELLDLLTEPKGIA